VRQIKILLPATAIGALSSEADAHLSAKLQAEGALGCYEKETLGASLAGILSSIRARA
jgi:hypothetical protein